MNRVELTGRLTRDAEIRYVGDGRYPITSLNLAVDDAEGRWNRETKKSELGSGFYKIEVVGEYGEEVHAMCCKGDRLYVLGSLSQYSVGGRDGREKESKTQVKATLVTRLMGSGVGVKDPTTEAPADPEVDPSWDEEPF